MSSIILASLPIGTVHLHLTTLILLFPIFLSENKSSVAAMLLGWALIITVQLFGQILVARKHRLTGIELYITPLALVTIFRHATKVYERALVAWGGIGGQALLAGISILLMSVLPLDRIELEYKSWLDTFFVTVFCNVLLILFNFYPRPPFPGSILWCVFRKSARPTSPATPGGQRSGKSENAERHSVTDDGDFIH